jgi:uncharacterized repeat protein (TIGR02543 family)
MRRSKMVAVITVLTLLSSFSTALSPTNASEDHSQHLTKLAAPNGVVTVPGSTSTVLRFTAVPNATSYKVRVYTVKGENPLRTIALFNSGQSVSALTPNSTYKITVQAIGNGVRYSNSEESRKVSVTTLSALAIPAFSLTPTVMTATAGQLFTSPTPVSTGGAIASFSIDAGIFPINGLSFNTSTGVISGTPITAWITNIYTITAHNSSGIASQSFTLITQAAPTVPDLSGLTQAAAEASLTANGFILGGVTTTTSGATSGNNGLVKTQTPTAGSALAASSSVDLVLYLYIAPTVPNVSGLTQAAAEASLTANGFILGGVTTTTSGATSGNNGLVKTQTPTAGSALAASSSVDLVLYLYIAPTVPNVSGLTQAAAEASLTANGFILGGVTTTTSGATSGNNGLVKTQTPTAGSALAASSSVDLVLYLYIAPLAPHISSISPTYGSTNGGTNVTIIGTEFQPGAIVYFGRQLLINVQVIDANTITGTTVGGYYDGSTWTVAYNSGVASNNDVNFFTYGPPSVSSISNASSALAGGTQIVFTGAFNKCSFGPLIGTQSSSYSVTIGGVAASDILITFGTSGTGTTLTATTPAGTTAGVFDIQITLVGVGTVILPGAFTYLAPTVPDLSGLTQAAAEASLTANGFILGGVTTTTSGATSGNNGLVKTQTPTAGSALAAGGSVAFVLYAYVAPAPPVVTAAHTPSAGGTATATDTFTGGMWSLSATPAPGYTFTNWACSNGAFADSAGSAETTVTPGSDITCTATFSVAPIVLYFNINYLGNGNDSGNLWGDGYTTFDVGTTATVTDELGTVAKSGYIFAGWNTQADGSGTARAVGDTFVMPSSDVDLYAQWVSNTFNITWSDNGGAGTSGGDSTYIGGSQITGLPVILPTYNGFKFIGWNTSPDGLGTDVSSGYMPQPTSPNIYSDIIFYAKWVNNTFNITWDQNFNPNTQGHWASSGDSTYVGGSAVGMPGMPSNQDGYIFATWQASDSSAYTSWGYVPIAPYGDITFTGVWTAIDISVNAIWDGGAMNPWTLGEGGDTLALTGTGFIAGTTVTIGGLNASITGLTDTSITVLTPIANDPGHMTVVVTSPNGSSASTTYFYQIGSP